MVEYRKINKQTQTLERLRGGKMKLTKSRKEYYNKENRQKRKQKRKQRKEDILTALLIFATFIFLFLVTLSAYPL